MRYTEWTRTISFFSGNMLCRISRYIFTYYVDGTKKRKKKIALSTVALWLAECWHGKHTCAKKTQVDRIVSK